MLLVITILRRTGLNLKDQLIAIFNRNKSFDEKLFAQNPMATDGGLDRNGIFKALFTGP